MQYTAKFYTKHGLKKGHGPVSVLTNPHEEHVTREAMNWIKLDPGHCTVIERAEVPHVFGGADD